MERHPAYRLHYMNGTSSADESTADRVLMWSSRATAEFKLPRDQETLKQVMDVIESAYALGEIHAKQEIRDLLGIKDCVHAD